MVLPFVSRESRQELTALIDRSVRTFRRDHLNPALRHPRPSPWALDGFLQRRGLDITVIAAISHPLLEIVMPDGVWTLNVGNVTGKRIYWSDNRGERHLIAASSDYVGSADHSVASRVVQGNGLLIARATIVRGHLPTQVATAIRPHGFLIDAFRANFDQVRAWEEVERRYGPRERLSPEQRAQIHAEISAPVRTWIAGLGIPDRVKEEVLRRERRPLVEKWLEEVLQ